MSRRNQNFFHFSDDFLAVGGFAVTGQYWHLSLHPLEECGKNRKPCHMCCIVIRTSSTAVCHAVKRCANTVNSGAENLAIEHHTLGEGGIGVNHGEVFLHRDVVNFCHEGVVSNCDHFFISKRMLM